MPASYRGRFAPSPTGPLHLGSLVTALASYLDARHCAGTWLVRMDDLDPPREIPGAAKCILQSLRRHGLHWDEDVMWQSRRSSAYQNALTQLMRSKCTFYCDCGRQQLGKNRTCCGRCQDGQSELSGARATRIRVPADYRASFKDQLQGSLDWALGQEIANFVVMRKDGLFAYQLAVVVDDAEMAISHILRGSDLLDSTARQLYIQAMLGIAPPHYCHIPVITHVDGHKLSKQSHAPAINDDAAPQNLRLALSFLNQVQPPKDLRSVDQILSFSSQNWSPESIPRTLSIPNNVHS